MHTSLNLIWKSSYGSVSVDDICKQADVKKGSFYHFFKSKSELTVAAMEEHWKFLKESYDKSFSASLKPLERFKAVCRNSIIVQQEKYKEFGHVCGCPCVSMGSEICGIDDNLRSKSAEISMLSISYFKNAIIEAVANGDIENCDPEAKANAIYSYMIGVMIQARVRNDLKVLEGLESGIMQMLGVKSSGKLAA